jgi:hypothetical protein
MKLTQKDFKLFKSECEKWIKKFGLLGWKVYYSFKQIEDKFGGCSTDYEGRVATIYLNPDFDCPMPINKTEQIKQIALHEALELLFSPLWGLTQSRQYSESEYEMQHHNIIFILEKILKE